MHLSNSAIRSPYDIIAEPNAVPISHINIYVAGRVSLSNDDRKDR
jgi:hypothetical protein